jgi:hypothetical protein
MSVDTAFVSFVMFSYNKRPTLQCREVRFVTVGVCLKFFMLVPPDVCKIKPLRCKVVLLVVLRAWLNDLDCAPNIVRVIKSRRMRWAGHVAHMGERRDVYRVLVGKPEGKRPLGRPRRGWEDNIKMDLQEVGCGGVDWIELAQGRERWQTLVTAVMNLRVPLNAGNFLTS